MDKGTDFEIDYTLINKTKIIKKNECRWDVENPIVNVKEFKITGMQLLGVERDITDDEILAWMRNAKQVKILPLIATSNVYLLATLATLSKTLSVLIEDSKTKIDNIEIDFLIGKGLIKHSKEFIRKPINKNYEPIITDFYENSLTTVMEINFSELKSSLNILIASLKVKGEDIRKIIKNVNHTDIEDYHLGIAKINEEDKVDIDKWTSKERGNSSKRVKEISFNENYDITTMLLKIVMSLPQRTDNESSDKFILIVPGFLRDALNRFFAKSGGNSTKNELDKKRLSNIMFLSYTNPTENKDPEVLIKSIPSYLTILSKYLNSNKIVYAIDEYFHSNLIDVLNNRKFQCEKFHLDIEEEIVKKLKEDDTTVNIKGSYINIKEQYIENKSCALRNLSDCIKVLEESVSVTKNFLPQTNVNDYEHILVMMENEVKEKRGNLQKALTEIEKKYIKKQKKELEVINDGFLAVQNDLLEQLKLIL